MSIQESKTIKGDKHILKIGMWSAWIIVPMWVLYAAVLFAGGVVKGLPREPYFALAEILTIISALVLVILMSAIHLCTARPFRIFSLLGLGWMFITAGITVTVHFAELTVGRQLDASTRNTFAPIFDFKWPALLWGIELGAWHLGFGLSVLFAAFAFQGNGREKAARIGLITTGLLCLFGLIGPVVGDLTWRLIGVFGYGVVFPIVGVLIARVFRHAPQDKMENSSIL
jgi:hypothetical protein